MKGGFYAVSIIIIVVAVLVLFNIGIRYCDYERTKKSSANNVCLNYSSGNFLKDTRNGFQNNTRETNDETDYPSSSEIISPSKFNSEYIEILKSEIPADDDDIEIRDDCEALSQMENYIKSLHDNIKKAYSIDDATLVPEEQDIIFHESEISI